MNRSATLQQEYALGHSEEELKRLDRQGAYLRPFSERILHEAGLRSGMRVLDLGCGTGDFSLVAAEIVGETGRVVGVDRSDKALAVARDRFRFKEMANGEFLQADATALPFHEEFDAIIGRLVLMYLPEPAAALRRVLDVLRPRGIVAFIDITISADIATGDLPLASQCLSWIREAFHRSGAAIDMGLRQGIVFHDAGLGWPWMLIEGVPVAGPDRQKFGWLAATVGSLLPVMERTGVVAASEVGIETLAERLVAQAAEVNVVAFPVSFGGAWATKPA